MDSRLIFALIVLVVFAALAIATALHDRDPGETARREFQRALRTRRDRL